MLVKGQVKYMIGTWSSEEDVNSSNWQELENMLCEVKQAAH